MAETVFARAHPNMSFSNFIRVFGFSLFSIIYAAQMNYVLGQYQELYMLKCAGNMKLKEVQAVFDNASEDFDNDFNLILILIGVEDADVVEYVLSKSVNMEPVERSQTIVRILQGKLWDEKHQICPGTSAHKIVLNCLEEMKKCDYEQGGYSNLEYSFGCLLLEGNVEVAEKFLEVGMKIPSGLFPQNIRKNQIGTINFLVKNGFDIRKEGKTIMNTMKSRELTVADFEFYISHGLPLEYKFVNRNWLELSLQFGRFDLARYVYKRGLRLSTTEHAGGLFYTEFQENIDQFIERLATQKTFTEIMKVLYIGNIDTGSILSIMPLEIIHVVILPLCELPKKEEVVKELFD